MCPFFALFLYLTTIHTTTAHYLGHKSRLLFDEDVSHRKEGELWSQDSYRNDSKDSLYALNSLFRSRLTLRQEASVPFVSTLDIQFSYVKEDLNQLCSSTTVFEQFEGTKCVDYAFDTANEVFDISSNRRVSLVNKGIAKYDVSSEGNCEIEVRYVHRDLSVPTSVS